MNLIVKPTNLSSGRGNEMFEAKSYPYPLDLHYPYHVPLSYEDENISKIDTTILADTHVEQF